MISYIANNTRPHRSTSLHLSHPIYPSVSPPDTSHSGLLWPILIDRWGGLLHTWGFSAHQFLEALSDEAPAGSPMDPPPTPLPPRPRRTRLLSVPVFAKLVPICMSPLPAHSAPELHVTLRSQLRRPSSQKPILRDVLPRPPVLAFSWHVSWTGMSVYGFLFVYDFPIHYWSLFPPFPPLSPKYKSCQRKLLACLVYSKSLPWWLLTKYLLNSLTKIIVKSFFWHCVIN